MFHFTVFGGDKDKVTIFGESAGAASVHYLILSKLSVGLFNQAIMQVWYLGSHKIFKI